MRKFKPLAQWMVASLSLATLRSEAAIAQDLAGSTDSLEPVGLRPLNSPADNLFARHSSHSSHSSHRSGSGGSSSYSPPAPAPSAAPRYSAPTPPAPPASSYAPQRLYTPAAPAAEPTPRYQPVDPGRAAAVSPQTTRITPISPTLSSAEKLRLQIMRVQLALLQLGIYDGEISGVLDAPTKESLKLFQRVKGFQPDGFMSTETLNALGVAAAQ
jgi:His-Xaa-Ser repeat protein HxsA